MGGHLYSKENNRHREEQRNTLEAARAALSPRLSSGGDRQEADSGEEDRTWPLQAIGLPTLPPPPALPGNRVLSRIGGKLSMDPRTEDCGVASGEMYLGGNRRLPLGFQCPISVLPPWKKIQSCLHQGEKQGQGPEFLCHIKAESFGARTVCREPQMAARPSGWGVPGRESLLFSVPLGLHYLQELFQNSRSTPQAFPGFRRSTP